jgi:hypothetical protein
MIGIPTPYGWPFPSRISVVNVARGVRVRNAAVVVVVVPLLARAVAVTV